MVIPRRHKFHANLQSAGPGKHCKVRYNCVAELMPHLLIACIFLSRNGPLEEGRMSDCIGRFHMENPTGNPYCSLCWFYLSIFFIAINSIKQDHALKSHVKASQFTWSQHDWEKRHLRQFSTALWWSGTKATMCTLVGQKRRTRP